MPRQPTSAKYRAPCVAKPRIALALLPLALLLFPPLSTRAAAAEPKPHVDLYGDPLPPGAIARLGTIRLRQRTGVTGIGFSANGRLIASCGIDQVVRVWDSDAFALRSEIALPEGKTPWAVCLTRNGSLVAAASMGAVFRDGRPQRLPPTIDIYNVKTRKATLQVNGMELRPRYIAFVGADKFLLSIDEFNTAVCLFDASTGERSRVIESPAHLCAASPERGLAAVGETSGRIAIWDVLAGRRIREIACAQKGITAMSLSSDGALLYVAAGASCELYNVKSGKRMTCVATSDANVVDTIAVSHDSRFVATFGSANTLRVWDTSAKKNAFERRLPLTGLRAVAFSPSDKMLCCSFGDDGAILVLTVPKWEFDGCAHRPANFIHGVEQ